LFLDHLGLSQGYDYISDPDSMALTHAYTGEVSVEDGSRMDQHQSRVFTSSHSSLKMMALSRFDNLKSTKFKMAPSS
jgi:hypothetical protein